MSRWRTVLPTIVTGLVLFVVLVVVSLVLADRQDQLVCDAISDNREVLSSLIEARREPVDADRFSGELGEALTEIQVRADEFADAAAVVLNTPPECAQ